MDDEQPQDEIVVSGAPSAGIKKPPSAWKAALVGLAGGPFVSLGFGLAQHFQNKSYLQNEADRQIRDANERARLTKTLDSEQKLADPDEQRMLAFLQNRITDGYRRIADGDKTGYDIISHVNDSIEQLIGGDMQARKAEVAKQHETQRDLVSTAAKGYRTEYQTTVDAFNAANNSAQQILALVSQKDFDPNKPINKAHLAELLSMGSLMFKDAPDLMDGLTEGVSAVNGVAGGIVGGIATMMKSEDFKVTPEDYNRLALNLQKYSKIYADQKLGQLGDQARNLDDFAKKTGVIPQDYSLGDYVSGGEKELRMTPNPVFTGGYKPPVDEQLHRAQATSALRNVQRWGNPYGNPPGRRGSNGVWIAGPQTRPTN